MTKFSLIGAGVDVGAGVVVGVGVITVTGDGDGDGVVVIGVGVDMGSGVTTVTGVDESSISSSPIPPHATKLKDIHIAIDFLMVPVREKYVREK